MPSMQDPIQASQRLETLLNVDRFKNIFMFILDHIELATQFHSVELFSGSARVEGDEEEDGDDDIYKEFSFGNLDEKETRDISLLKVEKQLNLGDSYGTDPSGYDTSISVPLLMSGEGVNSCDH